jgi:hypothetical protein
MKASANQDSVDLAADKPSPELRADAIKRCNGMTAASGGAYVARMPKENGQDSVALDCP